MSALATIGVAYLVASVALAAVCARDMARRGRDGELYAVVVLFVLPLGLGLWALDRRTRPPTEGPPA